MHRLLALGIASFLLGLNVVGRAGAAPAKQTPQDCGVDVRPQDLPDGDYGGFYTWPEIVKEMDGWLKNYPQIIRVQKLGTTFEGRSIPLLKISGNPEVDANKPQILYLVGVHPREEAPTVVIIRFVNELLSGYGKDAEITKLVDSRVIWVVPMLNVDGKIYDFQHGNKTTRGADWRKNRHPNPDGTYGVDLNRNFPDRWGGNREFDPSWGYSTTLTKGNIYEGASPASEPEVQAVMRFVATHPLRIMLDLHSPLHDMRCPAYLSVSEAPIYQQLFDDLQKGQKAPYSYGVIKGGTEPNTETRSGDSGISYPWSYYTTGAYSFNIEMGYKDAVTGKYTKGVKARYADEATVETEYTDNIRGPLMALLRDCGDLKLATSGTCKLTASKWEGQATPGSRLVWKPQISGKFDYAFAMSGSAAGIIPREIRLAPGKTGFPILIQSDAKPGTHIPLSLYVWNKRERSVFHTEVVVK